MKFRFCGELDCPDWVLAEIATLSRITSIKMKMISVQVVNSILGSPIDYAKISKLTSDAKYESGDIKASIAALTYIFTSAVKHAVEEESLANELQQLGLPRESTLALCRVFSEKYLLLKEQLRTRSMKFTELSEINWRVDYVLFSSVIDEVNDPSIVLGLKLKQYPGTDLKSYCFSMSHSKALLLLHDLKQLYNKMEELTSSS